MERLPLSSNKSNLLRLKAEMVFARDGLALLGEKKEALMAYIGALAGKADRVNSKMHNALDEAYRHLREAIATQGRLACERASLAAAMGEALEVREKSFMGVALPLVRMKLPAFLPRFGFQGTGVAMDSLARAIHRNLEVIAELAEIEGALFPPGCGSQEDHQTDQRPGERLHPPLRGHDQTHRREPGGEGKRVFVPVEAAKDPH
ncbi:MAG: V-type ATP synthase subunit D [Deltaproteobacteria bacterium]|nr:V-type ATP synthase subunit D [Deltaproteobacteria bacterium]